MKNIRLTLEYDGTRFCGWQRQKNGMTIEGTITKALTKLLGEEIEVFGCSRTDSGVHAKEYVCNFKTGSRIPIDKMPIAINQNLPSDIVVNKACEVSENFHSRFDTTGKTYTYYIYNNEIRNPFKERCYFHVRKELDLDAMIKASKFLIGKHDFEAFKNLGTDVHNNIRTIYALDIKKIDNDVVIQITGDGFLYNMVRIIVGTLVQIGMGQRSWSDMEKILLSKERKNAGKTAPAKGLFLEKVYYDTIMTHPE